MVGPIQYREMSNRTPSMGEPGDILMSHDTKVGLGLGILLVGFASALYFREQPLERTPLPDLESTVELEDRLSESVAEHRHQVSPLDQFEQKYRSDLDLPDVELVEEFPSPVVNSEEVASSDQEPAVVLNEPRRLPRHDPEFEFLNEPQVEPVVDEIDEQKPVVTKSDNPASQDEWTKAPVKKLDDPAQKSPDPRLPARPVVQSDSPPHELPPAVEMFSQDLLEAENAPYEDIPIELQPIIVDVIPNEKSPQSETPPVVSRPLELPAEEPVPESKPIQTAEPVRDPRIIVPKRVRLNEPVARRPEDSLFSSPSVPKTENVSPKQQQPKSNSARPARIPNELPTLEGLEPLDPSR